MDIIHFKCVRTAFIKASKSAKSNNKIIFIKTLARKTGSIHSLKYVDAALKVMHIIEYILIQKKIYYIACAFNTKT